MPVSRMSDCHWSPTPISPGMKDMLYKSIVMGKSELTLKNVDGSSSGISWAIVVGREFRNCIVSCEITSGMPGITCELIAGIELTDAAEGDSTPTLEPEDDDWGNNDKYSITDGWTSLRSSETRGDIASSLGVDAVWEGDILELLLSSILRLGVRFLVESLAGMTRVCPPNIANSSARGLSSGTRSSLRSVVGEARLFRNCA